MPVNSIRLRGYSSLSVARRKSSRNRKVGLPSAIAMPSSIMTPSSGGTPFATAKMASASRTSRKSAWPYLVRPTRLREVDLVVALERLPDLQSERLERVD